MNHKIQTHTICFIKLLLMNKYDLLHYLYAIVHWEYNFNRKP